MKKLSVFIILLITFSLSGYICWEENGKAIRQEINLNFTGSVIKLSEEDLAAVWSDASSGEQEVKLQKITTEGEMVWEEPVILTTCECYCPNGEVLIESENNEIVTAWYELSSTPLIRVQRIDADGNLLWGDDGIIIELDSEASCMPLRLISDNSGGVFLVWRNWVEHPRICGIYLDNNGVTGEGWEDNGTILMQGGSDLKALPDGNGGIIVMTEYNDQGFLQRYDNQGNQCWNAGQTELNGLEDCYEYDLFPLSEDEYAILIRTQSSFTANVINSEGELLYNELQSYLDFDNEEYTGRYDAAVTMNDELCLSCEVSSSSTSRLILQRRVIGDEPVWGEEGITVMEMQPDYQSYDPVIAIDGDDGIYLSWKFYQEDGDRYKMFYQHYDHDGNVINGTEPYMLCDQSIDIMPGKLLPAEDGPAVFWYMIKNGDQEIRYQMFDDEDNILLPEEGNSLFCGLAGTTHNPAALVTSGGRTVVCWDDTRNGDDNVYLQLIDNFSGDLLFAETGIPLIIDDEHPVEDPIVSISNDGESICTVGLNRHFSEENWIVQIIDDEGNRLLGDSGQQINDLHPFIEVETCNKSDGGILISWMEWNNNPMTAFYYLKAQAIIDNELAWGDGVIVTSAYNINIGFLALCDNKISWVENSGNSSKLKIVSLEEDGSISPGWEEGGKIIADFYYIHPDHIFMDGTDALIFWDGKVTMANNQQVFGQKLSESGEVLWEEGGRYFFENSTRIPSYSFHNGSIYYIKLQDDECLTLNKVDQEGNSLWENEVIIDEGSDLWETPITFYDDRIIVYWVNMNNDVCAKIFYDDGSLVNNIPAGGLIVCDQQHEQEVLSCCTDEYGNSIVLWNDRRGEYLPEEDPGLYVQKLDLNMVPVTESDIPDGDHINMSNYPNPFTGSTILKCELLREVENGEIVIYNIKGQKVRSLPAAGSEVIWDCRNDAGKLAGSGIYFYRMRGEGIESRTGRMIMLK